MTKKVGRREYIHIEMDELFIFLPTQSQYLLYSFILQVHKYFYIIYALLGKFCYTQVLRVVLNQM